MVKRCWWLVVVISFGACFSPSFTDNTIQCGPNGECPPGLDCVAGVCRTANGSDTMAPPAPMLTSVTPTSPANNNSPVIVGSAEAGATIRIFSDATCMTEVGTGTAAALASPGIGITVGDDSTSSFAATARDAVGNTSPCSAGLPYVEDSTPPATPSLTSTVPPSPSRSIVPSIRGAGEPGATVLLYGNETCGGTMLMSGVVDAAGAFAITATVPTAQVTKIAAIARDPAGNLSPCSGFISYQQDASAVSAPALVSSTPLSPSSTITMPTITGTAEAGITVRLYTDQSCSGTLAGMGTASGAGAFSIAVTVGSNSTTTYYALAVDTAVNIYSPCSQNGFTYIHDNTPPATPSVSGSTPPSPSNSGMPMITGTAEIGATVDLYTAAGCTGSVAATGTVGTGGTFSIQATVTSTTTFYAKTRDGAGNASGCSTGFLYTRDQTPPGIPTLSTIPASPSATNNTPLVTGIAEVGATVRVYRTVDCTGTEAGTGIASSPTGSFAIGVTVASNSSTPLTTNATDAAGNTSTCSSALTYVHDSLAPSAPLITMSTPTSPSNVNAPTISGSAEAGNTVQLYSDSGCTTTIGSPVVATGSGRFDSVISVGPDSSWSLYAKATDGAGNASGCSTSAFSYEEDSTPPGAPVINALAPSSTNLTPTLAGSGLAGATIKIYASTTCGGSVVAMGPATGGSFSIGVTVTANSATPFSATATDAAGNVSVCSAAITYIHDNMIPNPPTGLASNPVSPAGSNTPQITGMGEVNTTVNLFTNAGCSSAIVGSGTVTGGGTFAVGVTVSNGSTTTFYATVTDAANNESNCSGVSSFVTYLHDAIPPGPPTALATTPPSPSPSMMPTVTGNAEANSTVRLYTNNNCTSTLAAMGVTNGSGMFSIPTTVTPNVTTTFWATANDGSNTSTCSTSNVVFLHDATPPSVPSILASSPTSPANNNNPVISGTAEPGSTVSIWVSSNCMSGLLSTGTATGAGTFAIGISVADNITSVIYASAKDAAGNTFGCSSSFTYIENSAATETPTLTSTTPASPTNLTLSPTLNGTTVAGYLIRIYTDPMCLGAILTSTTPATASFSVTVSATANATTTYYATADNGATVSSCSAGFSYVHDNVIPSAPTGLFVTPSSPANQNNPSVGGNATAGTTVKLYTNSNCTSAVSGSSVADAAGSFSIAAASVADNSTTTYFATATDPAGNASGCSTTGVTYVEDSAPPGMPTVTSTTPGSPGSSTSPFVNGTGDLGATVNLYATGDCTGSIVGTGNVSTGNLYSIQVSVGVGSTTTFKARATDTAGNASPCSATSVTYVQDSTPPAVPILTLVTPPGPANNNFPVVNGSTDEAGATIKLYSDSLCTSAVIGSNTSGSGPAFAFTVTATVSDNTTTTIYATATDAGGNASACSTSSKTYTEDSQAPDKPSNLGTAPPPPANNNNPSVTGIAEDGVTVKVYTTLDCTGSFGSAVVTGGSFSIARLVTDDSTTTFYTTATDTAGNTSGCSVGVVYVEDSTANPPVLTSTNPTSPSSSSTNPTISGTGEIGATIKLFRMASCSGLDAASGTVSAAGTFALSVTVVGNTATTFFGQIVDQAGNVSACSTGITYIHDDTAPTFMGPTSAVGTGTNTILVSWASATDNFTNAASMRYDVCWRTTPTGACTTGATTSPGATSYVIPGLTQSQRYWILVRAMDQAGNPGLYLGPVSATTFGAGASIAIASGQNFTCSLLSEGTVQCWGANGSGQLGNGSAVTQSLTPVVVSGLDDVVAIAAGGANVANTAHACAVKSDGTVWCWGGNIYGQLGIGSTTPSSSNVPVQVLGIANAVATIGAGNSHTCVGLANGNIKCWGFNLQGQLGNGTTTSPLTTPVIVTGITTAVAVETGFYHSCALLANGTVRCWGDGDNGKLGNGAVADSSNPVTVSLPASSPAKAIDVGAYHACVVLHNGEVRCWGYNLTGQLGTNNTADSSTPVASLIGGTAITNVTAIGTGGSYLGGHGYGTTCATLATGAVKCWGYNATGQLGDGTTAQALMAVNVTGSSDATQVSVGVEHSCYRTADGLLRCFGNGGNGRLGNGGTGNSSTQVSANVYGIESGVRLEGSYGAQCARLSNGKVKCWGRGDYGQRGDGSTADQYYPLGPVLVGGAPIVAIDADWGFYFGCAVRSGGSVVCWGLNASGQLGNGTTIDATNGGVVVLGSAASGTPETACGDGQDNDADSIVDDGCPFANAIQVATGNGHSCALVSNGTVKCWGSGASGQLGDGTSASSTTAVQVSGLTNVVDIELQGGASCARIADGAVKCWGYGLNGNLGNNSTANAAVPVTVIGGVVDAIALTGMGDGACALLAGGTMKCWGYGGNGEMGNGLLTANNLIPVGVTGTDYTQIGSARNHVCAVRSGGVPWCWGRNNLGQCGIASIVTPQSSPVMTMGLGTVFELSGGRGDSQCALHSDGTAECWGWGAFGQLGTGNTANQLTPATVIYFP